MKTMKNWQSKGISSFERNVKKLSPEEPPIISWASTVPSVSPNHIILSPLISFSDNLATSSSNDVLKTDPTLDTLSNKDSVGSTTVITATSTTPPVSLTPFESQISTLHKSSLKEQKLGHRRVGEDGLVTYKKKSTSELKWAIQLGIGQSVGGLSPKPRRDLLYMDFSVVDTVCFPREGSNLTPAHRLSDFKFKTYAPLAFRYFRDIFNIPPEDFMLSLCNEPLKESSNPGASGSIFYISNDDEFIIKTVQKKEAEFLQKLLPGYFMNLNQNPRTLLPKFYGLYCYQCGGKNIRFVIMNNLLPSCIQMHCKFDLKGSTYKRKASTNELAKPRPTYKDLDFQDLYPDGLFLDSETHAALCKAINRDCRVLQSFQIMDYSMLIGLHNVSSDAKGNEQASQIFASMTANKTKSRMAQFSTPLDSIQVQSASSTCGGIPGKTASGDSLLIFMGVIDILQSYRLFKRLEHTLKSMITDGDSISVHKPSFYSQRFQSFFSDVVFKKLPMSLKPSTKRKHPEEKNQGREDADSSIPSNSSPVHLHSPTESANERQLKMIEKPPSEAMGVEVHVDEKHDVQHHDLQQQLEQQEEKQQNKNGPTEEKFDDEEGGLKTGGQSEGSIEKLERKRLLEEKQQNDEDLKQQKENPNEPNKQRQLIANNIHLESFHIASLNNNPSPTSTLLVSHSNDTKAPPTSFFKIGSPIISPKTPPTPSKRTMFKTITTSTTTDKMVSTSAAQQQQLATTSTVLSTKTSTASNTMISTITRIKPLPPPVPAKPVKQPRLSHSPRLTTKLLKQQFLSSSTPHSSSPSSNAHSFNRFFPPLKPPTHPADSTNNDYIYLSTNSIHSSIHQPIQ